MADFSGFFEKLPAGAGKNVNKKQFQDFIKAVLFEKSMAELSFMQQTDYKELSGGAYVVIQAVSSASHSGDTSKIKPLLDFAFEREKGRK